MYESFQTWFNAPTPNFMTFILVLPLWWGIYGIEVKLGEILLRLRAQQE